jgi:hypothetical protein
MEALTEAKMTEAEDADPLHDVMLRLMHTDTGDQRAVVLEFYEMQRRLLAHQELLVVSGADGEPMVEREEDVEAEGQEAPAFIWAFSHEQ